MDSGLNGRSKLSAQRCAPVDRVHQLHREAQPGPCLPQAPFHHVARAEFFAGRAHVHCLVRIVRGRASRDHPQIGKARQAGHDLLGQPFGQRRDLRVRAAVLERQHGDPEAVLARAAIRNRLAATARVAEVDAGATVCDDCRARSRNSLLTSRAVCKRSRGSFSRQRRRIRARSRGTSGRGRSPKGADRAGSRRSSPRRMFPGTAAAGRHLIEHDAEREDVGPMVERAARRLLRATCRPASPSPRPTCVRLVRGQRGIARGRTREHLSPARSRAP